MSIEKVWILRRAGIRFQCCYCSARLDSADDIPRHEEVCPDKRKAEVSAAYEWGRFLKHQERP